MPKHNILDLATSLDLEAERKIAATSNRTPRVKIERGHAWKIRIIPFPQGPARETFARLGQHWLGGRPVMCKITTSPNFGGDPSYDCPICATAAEGKNDARDDAERDEFYDVESRMSFRCYCLVIAKENDRGQLEEMSGEEILVPYEFIIPKATFATLSAKIERSKSRPGASPMGILDVETGTDLWAIRDKKNSLTFDLSEDGPQPIFTQDEFFDEKLARVLRQCKQPSVKWLDDKRMNSLADMVAEKAFIEAGKSLSERSDSGRGRGDSGRDSRGGSRGRFHESDEAPRGRGRSEEEAPRGRGRAEEGEEAPRSRSAAPSGRFARAQAALGDDDQIPGAEVPARGRGRAEEAPPEDEAPRGRGRAEEAPPEDEAPPVTGRRGGAAARPAAAAPGRVSVPAAVAAGRRAGAPPPPPEPRETGRIADDAPGEGEPAEEDKDPAPAEAGEVAPVTQTSRPAPARSSLQGQLRTSVANLASRGR